MYNFHNVEATVKLSFSNVTKDDNETECFRQTCLDFGKICVDGLCKCSDFFELNPKYNTCQFRSPLGYTLVFISVFIFIVFSVLAVRSVHKLSKKDLMIPVQNDYIGPIFFSHRKIHAEHGITLPNLHLKGR